MFGFLGRDLGIDLGTVNTLIARRDGGIILRERSAVAVDKNNKIMAVGEDAMSLVGRAPGGMRVIYPLQEGVVADLVYCEAMLRHFIEKSIGRGARRLGVRAVLCVPGRVTDVEKRALEEAAKGAGAKAAFLLDEPVAAALGAGLPVEEPVGSLVVDIGGGTTDAALLALGGVVNKNSVRAGGTHIDAAIINHFKRAHSLGIGSRAAEEIKLKLGAAVPSEPAALNVRGRDIQTGLPRSVRVTALEIYDAIKPQIERILNCVREVLCEAPPELSADIYDYGMWLTGGGALLKGIAQLFCNETGIKTNIARHPMDCVVEGARIACENMGVYKARVS